MLSVLVSVGEEDAVEELWGGGVVRAWDEAAVNDVGEVGLEGVVAGGFVDFVNVVEGCLRMGCALLEKGEEVEMGTVVAVENVVDVEDGGGALVETGSEDGIGDFMVVGGAVQLFVDIVNVADIRGRIVETCGENLFGKAQKSWMWVELG